MVLMVLMVLRMQHHRMKSMKKDRKMSLRFVCFLVASIGLLIGVSQAQAAFAQGGTAQQTSLAAQASTTNYPVWMYIASIDMSQPVIPVGLDANGMPIVPDHEPGWFNQSARPGEGENIVLWGHVLRFRATPHIPAPFGRIKELTLGTPIHIFTANGEEHVYVVQQQLWVTPDQVQYILPQGSERLTLVSCIGEQIIVDGSVEDMSHRLITIAVPAR
jgi:sortase (surface protein transpeptidase)